MIRQAHAIRLALSVLLIVATATTTTTHVAADQNQTTAIKNELNLVTTRNEYILKHILANDDLNEAENEITSSATVKTEPAIESEAVKTEPAANTEPQREYNVNEPTDKLDAYEDREGFLSRQKTFVDLYHEGVLAYLSNDWIGCISLMERAIVQYQDYYNTLTYCRVSCDLERNRLEPKFEDDYEHLHFYEGILKKTLCLEKCRRTHLLNVSKFFNLEYDDKILFKQRKPYHYLQICYHKDKQIKKAIDASFTALVGDPEDEILLKNIKYYASLGEFDYEAMRDLEDKEYSKYYLRGVAAYNQKNFTETIENMEAFIALWIQEFDKCRAFCENDYSQGWLPDYTTAVANHYVYTLRCKRNCTADLSLVNGRRYSDPYATSYDYLQYSYYQVGEILKGARCVASYLMIYPESPDMLDSHKYYSALPNVTEKYFTPRPEAKRYAIITDYEEYLFDFVEDEFSKLLLTEDITFPQLPVQSDLPEHEEVQNATEAAANVDEQSFVNIIKNFFAKWRNGTAARNNKI